MAMRDVRLANESWEALLAAHAAVLRRFGAEGTWDEVSLREYDVLYTLSKAGRPLKQVELNRAVLLSQPALSRLLDRLADRDLVARQADPDDRRGSRLALTTAGAAVQQRTGARHARSVEAGMRALDPDQQRRLRDLCALLTADPAPAPADQESSTPS